jgi:DNA-binding GntR family transcriptional regulator
MDTKLDMINLKREIAHQRLRDAIVFGRLKPGEKVVQEMVAEMLQIGRTPLREALRQLETEGYLEVVPNKGAVVRKLSVQEVEECYEVLASLEGYAVKRATRLLDSSAFEEFRAIEKRMMIAAKARDYDKCLEENALFHRYFHEVVQNSLLSKQIENLRGQTYRYRAFAVSISDNVKENLAEHRRILEAVAAGNAEKACKAMQQHVLNAGSRLKAFFLRYPWV